MLQSAGIQNTGFETADSGQIGKAQMWNGANLTKDKRTCNTISPPATYSHTGDCAFLFKGGIGEKSKISQKVKLGATSLVAGSPLTLSAWVSSSSNTVLAQVVAYHTDATRIAFSVLMARLQGTRGLPRHRSICSKRPASSRFLSGMLGVPASCTLMM